MRSSLSGFGRSPSLKVLLIGALVLLLLIPMVMIEGVVHDRSAVHREARNDIVRSWGGEQLIAGPVLVVPCTHTYRDDNGRQVVREHLAYALARRLEVDASVNPEIRYRGLHKVPVYTATLAIRGELVAPDLDRMGMAGAVPHWERTRVAMTVADARAIATTPQIEVGGQAVSFEPGVVPVLAELPAPIVAAVGNLFPGRGDAGTVPFSLELRVKGSGALRLLPLGDTTEASMSSTWPAPSFVGNYLPETREVSPSGFTAEWRISSLGRNLPSQWSDRSAPRASAAASAFGVAFYMPVSLYQTMLRATRYAVLFIGLSFVAYFLFEIMGDLRLHPLQYLLVGFANALFYLLLLSMAEHVGFGWAYLGSAAASTGLIAGYSGAILGRRLRGLLMALMLAALYLFLYMTLKAESYALVAGAVGLWLALAAVMYLTRRIDWYAHGNDGARASAGQSAEGRTGP